MAFIREVLKASLNASRSVQIELISITLGSSQWWEVMVNGQTEEARNRIQDADEWHYSTLEKALIAFSELETKWQWFGAGSAPAVITPVTTGLTLSYVNAIRSIFCEHGLTSERWDNAMSLLRKNYQANKATSERGIDWADNIHGHALV